MGRLPPVAERLDEVLSASHAFEESVVVKRPTSGLIVI